MKEKMRGFKNLGITTKFIIWFLLISAIPLVISAFLSYGISRKILKQELANKLSVIADNKANQIESHLQRLKNDGAALFSSADIIEQINKLSSSFNTADIDQARYESNRQELAAMFNYYARLFGFEDITLANSDGYIMLSVKSPNRKGSLYEEAITSRSELTDIFMKAKASGDMEISNFEYFKQDNKLAAYIAIPIFEPQGLLAIVLLQFDNQMLYKFAQDYIGLGKTGEALLVCKIKDEAVFAAPSRFDPEAALKRRVKLGSKDALDIQRSIQGKAGSGTFVDYRNKDVLSVWRYLSPLKLGMVVKMDTREIFAPADTLRDTLLKMSFFFLAVVLYVALFIARAVSRPIKNLTAASKTITQGDLSARADIEALDEVGELAQSFNLMTDSLVEAKQKVEEQKTLLEKANKELDSFVYTASHDLRAPLRGIDGLAEIMQQDYAAKIDDQGRECLQKIRSAAIRMKALIDDLLKLSRISRIKNPYEDTDMDSLLKSIAERLEFDIKKNNVEFSIPLGLPVIHCDKIKIEEAIFNLVSNAIKFSAKNNSARPKVELGYAKKDDKHQFYVRDNGIGIDKKNHSEIFGIFKRLHKESEYEGTGAGLSIVKKIVEDHGGSIWVESELGSGAAFYFTIPCGLRESLSIHPPLAPPIKGGE